MGGVLAEVEIKERLLRNVNDLEGLVITPLLDPDQQIGVDSVDLRLGTYFIVFKSTSIPVVKFGGNEKIGAREFQTRVHIPLGQEIIVPPSTLILGSVLEYIKMPYNVYGAVGSRSSWGRLGLIIATAINIHPCFRGCLTLEIVNHGNIPISLSPGMRIAQLILHHVSRAPRPEYPFKGKYTGSTKPEFSRLDEEADDVARLRLISKEYHSEIPKI